MRLETVAESFATYRAKVMPPTAGPVQIEETRRAFYAGVYFCLMNLAYNIGDDSTDEEQGVIELEKLKAECEAFASHTGQPLPHAEPPPPVVVPPPDYQTDQDAAIRPVAKDLGRIISSQLPAGWGFTLLLFTFGPGGTLSYISNADRSDMLLTMKEFIKRQTQ
jgi:hypothetical protein